MFFSDIFQLKLELSYNIERETVGHTQAVLALQAVSHEKSTVSEGQLDNNRHCRYGSFSKLEKNTIMMSWNEK